MINPYTCKADDVFCKAIKWMNDLSKHVRNYSGGPTFSISNPDDGIFFKTWEHLDYSLVSFSFESIDNSWYPMAFENEPALSGSKNPSYEDSGTNNNSTELSRASSTTGHQSHSESENEQQTINAASEDSRRPSSYDSDYSNNSKETSEVETSSSTLSITTRASSVVQHTTTNDIRRSPYESNTTPNNKNITMPPSSSDQQQRQEDTFYQSLQIRLHHSVGSMSISPTCRDIVLAG